MDLLFRTSHQATWPEYPLYTHTGHYKQPWAMLGLAGEINENSFNRGSCNQFLKCCNS